MTTEFNQGYVEGLKEALRLMELEESIDLGPGRILKRIEHVKAEGVDDPLLQQIWHRIGELRTDVNRDLWEKLRGKLGKDSQ